MKIDIGGAYLNTDINRDDIFMILDKDVTVITVNHMPELKPFVRRNGTMIVRLRKALYGLIQSAKLWYENLTAFLKSQGFKENEIDNCVMNKVMNGRQVTILIYVDDILVLATDEQDLDYVTKILKDQYESLTIA